MSKFIVTLIRLTPLENDTHFFEHSLTTVFEKNDETHSGTVETELRKNLRSCCPVQFVMSVKSNRTRTTTAECYPIFEIQGKAQISTTQNFTQNAAQFYALHEHYSPSGGGS